MTELTLQQVSLTITGQTILHDITLSLVPGEMVVLLGANGAGKTSILRCAMGFEKRASGIASLNGTPTRKMRSIERAKLVSYLPQQRPMAWPILVSDVVSLGRYAYGVKLGRLSGRDLDAVQGAIHACSLEHLADRRMDTLSGGEKARVHCARAFAARTDLLLADEPTAALDPRHQFRVMQLVREYVDNGGGALVVVHEASLAGRFADRIIWLKDGEIIANGSPQETLTKEMIAAIYGVRARIDSNGEHWAITVVDVI